MLGSGRAGSGTPPSQADSAVPGPSATDTGPKVTRDDYDALLAQLDRLEKRVDTVGKQLDATPGPEPAPDLGPIKSDLAELSKRTKDLAALPEQVKQLDDRLAKVSDAVASSRSQAESLRKKAEAIEKNVDRALGGSAPAPSADGGRENRPAPASSEVPRGNQHASTERTPIREPRTDVKPAGDEPKPADGEALNRGITLFKQGKYREALGIFNPLVAKKTDDARAYYFAALSYGFASRQWGSAPERLAELGIERERAGTPKSAVIDAALADLTPANGKDWITEQRKRVKSQ